MEQSQALSELYSIIAETFNWPIAKLTPSTVAEDVDGWDSLAHTILMIRVQSHFNLNIPEKLATRFKNVGDLASGICRLAAEQGK